MDTNAISAADRLPARREVLWNELEQLHAQLGIAPPTATYGVEELEEEVTLARRTAQQPAVSGQAQFDSLPFDAPPDGGDHRPRKTWRNFYAALFFNERPTSKPYASTPSEDSASMGGTSDK